MRIIDMLERNAQLYASRQAAVVADGPTFTFAELRDRVRQLAGGLSDAGVGSGDRVALMAGNGMVFFDIYLAVSYLGAATVPINTSLTGPEVRYIIENAEPVLSVADAKSVPRLADVMGGRRLLEEGSGDYENLLKSDPLTHIDGPTENDVALIIYTSGTTGQPKGVCLTQRGLAFNGITMALVQEFRQDDIYLSTTPLYHAATGTRVFSMLADGQTHVLLPSFDVEKFLSTIEKYRVTITVLVPAQLRQILGHPKLHRYDISSLRLIVYGAAPTASPLIQQAHEIFDCELYQGYGISECVTNLTGLLPVDHDAAMAGRPELLESCGRPVPGVRLELRNDLGELVPTGEVGEVYVWTEKVMAGYWRDPDKTDAAIVNGWFRTGDLARVDSNGYYYIVGRVKDMLISGGVNVYPSEIEAVLHSHPAVAEAAVVGRPDDEWGERPVAFVQLAESCQESELRELCLASLAKVKVPSAFLFVSEFPRTATGKIRKVELRERLGSY